MPRKKSDQGFPKFCVDCKYCSAITSNVDPMRIAGYRCVNPHGGARDMVTGAMRGDDCNASRGLVFAGALTMCGQAGNLWEPK